MNMPDILGLYDIDIALKDAGTQADLRPTQRAIANASIGVPAEDAFYSVRELRQAVAGVHEDLTGAHKRLTGLLANDCDDFQRCIYYNLAGRGVVTMLDDLEWLEGLLEARLRVFLDLYRSAHPVLDPGPVYVAPAPDGPTPVAVDRFELGPSWSYCPLPE